MVGWCSMGTFNDPSKSSKIGRHIFMKWVVPARSSWIMWNLVESCGTAGEPHLRENVFMAYLDQATLRRLDCGDILKIPLDEMVEWDEMRVSVEVFSVAQFFPLQLASLTGAEHYLPWLLAVCKAGWQAAVDSMNWLGKSTRNHNVYHEI